MEKLEGVQIIKIDLMEVAELVLKDMECGDRVIEYEVVHERRNPVSNRNYYNSLKITAIQEDD